MKRSPLLTILLLSGAFIALVAIVFFSRSDETSQQITMGDQIEIEPTAENVDPTFHSRLMALRQEVEAAPRDTSKLLELARMNQDGHQMVEAAEVYERLLAVAPEHKQARLDLALCYSELSRWDDAQSTMEDLLARYPGDPSALYNLGAIHANQGRYDEALDLWTRVQAQSEDVHLASQATASLAQLEALRAAPPNGTIGNQATGSAPPLPAGAPSTLPEGHPTVPANGYEPVIAGQ